MSEKILLRYVQPKLSKKVRKNRRKIVGYDEAEPEMCQNCKHFQKSLYSKETREFFPPRCVKHEFQVTQYAICDEWSDINE